MMVDEEGNELFTLTKHAAKRWMQRNECSDPAEARRSYDAEIREAKEVFPTSIKRMASLMNHEFRDTRYFATPRWVFLVDGKTIVTLYRFEPTHFCNERKS